MFKLEIKTGGSAFRDEYKEDKNGDFALDEYGTEVRRILRKVIKELEAGCDGGKIVDINGNCVGQWKYE